MEVIIIYRSWKFPRLYWQVLLARVTKTFHILAVIRVSISRNHFLSHRYLETKLLHECLHVVILFETKLIVEQWKEEVQARRKRLTMTMASWI